MAKSANSFKTESEFRVGSRTYRYHSVNKFKTLPYSLKLLLENLLRHEDGVLVRKADIETLINWKPHDRPQAEIQFMPARVLLQDYTGVPALADLAAMRDALKRLGGDPKRVNPIQRADLVIDHSVQVDFHATHSAFTANARLEFERNKERYEFLRWGQNTFKNFRVVPPDTGIVHQVNLEYLAEVATISGDWIYPDTLIGTDSHSTMINGLGVLGWGVGGIEAEAAMLGQPCSMLIPEVVGCELSGKLNPGITATDLVLTVTEVLRKKGVVGKFVEFIGAGAATLPVADRATIANMAPEYGATCGIFPVDQLTMDFLRLTGRTSLIPSTKAYYKAQGLWNVGAVLAAHPENFYSELVKIDLNQIERSLSGPSRPQDRVALSKVPESFRSFLKSPVSASENAHHQLTDGSVVIAAITSCTNTSNPSLLIAAGLLAKRAVKRGLACKPWVKTSLAPGSKAVVNYLKTAGLLPYLEDLGFQVVAYGCTTCIGNSGPLDAVVSRQIRESNITTIAVLSGNRNFEGRIHPDVRANYLASPPLVVAYALTGHIGINLSNEPVGMDREGRPVLLSELWPESEEIHEYVRKYVTPEEFQRSYQGVFSGSGSWQDLTVIENELYPWKNDSTYIKQPPFFEDVSPDVPPVKDIQGARVLALFGDSITTDHISPAGSFTAASPAGRYLLSLGVRAEDFNSYGARRGNHEVMVRGTFSNVRLKNRLLPGTAEIAENQGGMTVHLPDGEVMSIYDASRKYLSEGTPLLIVAGKEYGSGSSRDWAAKGPKLLGVRAVLAESYERIHRSNLVGMGILPLQFLPGESLASIGLTGREIFDIRNLEELFRNMSGKVEIVAKMPDTESKHFQAVLRIDTPNEVVYFRNGGILPYVLRQQLRQGAGIYGQSSKARVNPTIVRHPAQDQSA
ncbi:MAG: aconitate hydratase 1 [Bdellovibrionales bacterium RIFOXYC1_FULL_54_43]|nr:MAG: aconitate hydratase 1 [Bdellovibrionales bacterium RIFOXYC1_FULL_54_43]OFZ81436.1 MAG: aconitate hydratase 1 [Bdellovibrionales bacterium RIFOXYD1_FULL_55_31]